MAKFTRVSVSRQAEVPVSAAEYWDALLDWGAVLEWMPKESPPMPLARCEVPPGQSVSKPPCSRVLYFDKSKLPPGVDPSVIPAQVEETLLYVDAEARFLYYNLTGQLPFNMCNYLAYTEVDEIGPDRALVRNTGRVDVPEGSSAEAISALLIDTYDRAIIKGIGDMAARKCTRR